MEAGGDSAMGKDSKKTAPQGNEADQVDPNARHTVSDQDKVKARKWFARAQQLVETRSYDYAIKCYIDGLNVWPEAVDEGHQPLRGCGVARQHTGGKRPGFGETVKHSMSNKDPLKAMLNAEWLLAHDPMNVGYMEGLLKNANRAHCEDTVTWMGPIYRHAAENEKKPSPKRFALLKEVYEELGDRAQARREAELAVQAYRLGIEALAIQARMDPKDASLANVQRDLSTKLTILKGQYQTAESFQESIQDREAQADLHDEERMVQSDDRLDQLIVKAEREMAENPGVIGKVMSLVELLCRQDNEERETKAIGILVTEYKGGGEYRYKMRADDIRMRQLGREFRRAKTSGDKEAAREALTRQLRYELNVFAERVKKYPTDQRMRYEHGLRLFQAKRFDDAIPLFQAARGDPKNRTRCDLYLGRCFHEKGYHSQAMATLSKALEAYEFTEDETAKALKYWLGRSQEGDGQVHEALATYGELLQVDYNYRDVRGRIDGLKNQ